MQTAKRYPIRLTRWYSSIPIHWLRFLIQNLVLTH